MKQNIDKLHQISQKKERIIIGTMSGTSLDGLDVALCSVKNHGKDTVLSVLHFKTITYNEEFKEEIRKIFSQKTISLELLCLLNEKIGIRHAQMINECIAEWNIKKEEIDLIASHGQTIYHAPKSFHKNDLYGNGTLQIGDGDHIAVNTGIITISDFRQKHIAAGGEGAPLAAYGDYILFSQKDRNTILLNIGGISNFTYVPSNCSFGKIATGDIGPGNILMDTWTRKHFPEKQFDEGAEIALSGNINNKLLSSLKKTAESQNKYNKTTGAEIFNLDFVENCLQASQSEEINEADVMSTLNRFTAMLICEKLDHEIKEKQNTDIFVSGGGIHNPMLMDYIKNHFSQCNVESTLARDIHPDAKEASLFALLANEMIAGEKKTFGKGSDSSPCISMGKISVPD